MASILNLSGLIRSHSGAWINEQWVGCGQSDLSNYWKLVAIGAACSMLPSLFFIRLIPTRKSIEGAQQEGDDGK